jgi:hypothetical protein
VQVVLDFDREGEKALVRALDGLPTAIQKKIVKQVMRPASKPILKDAQRRASVLTGAMKLTMRVRAMRNSRMGYSGVVVMTGTREDLAGKTAKKSGKQKGELSARMKGIAEQRTAKKAGAILNDKFYYPAIVEYGAMLPDGTLLRARPYMRPALEAKRAEAMGIVNRLLWPLIEKAAAKLALKGPRK